jgi:hypothetical protein
MKKLALIILFVSSSAFAWQQEFSGNTYKCDNLNTLGIFTISGNDVHFVLGEQDIASSVEHSLDQALTPPGSGGLLVALSAWAAGTVVRVPDIAFSGPRSFRLPWANLSLQGYGSHKGIGTCKLVQGL